MDSRFVHVDEPIAVAMTLVPNADSIDKAIARQWAYMALRDIGPGEHWFEGPVVLYPNANRSFKKPDDMYKAINLALYDSLGNEFRYSYRGQGKRIHRSDNVLIDTGEYAPMSHAPVDLSEDRHCYHLGTNGVGVAYMALTYLKLPIDEKGLPLIPEHQVMAIAMFIRWMWSIKENVANDRQLSRQDWIVARNEAKSRNKMPSGIEMEQIAKEWTNLLNAPQFKQF